MLSVSETRPNGFGRADIPIQYSIRGFFAPAQNDVNLKIVSNI
jgi:hypothetical protein